MINPIPSLGHSQYRFFSSTDNGHFTQQFNHRPWAFKCDTGRSSLFTSVVRPISIFPPLDGSKWHPPFALLKTTNTETTIATAFSLYLRQGHFLDKNNTHLSFVWAFGGVHLAMKLSTSFIVAIVKDRWNPDVTYASYLSACIMCVSVCVMEWKLLPADAIIHLLFLVAYCSSPGNRLLFTVFACHLCRFGGGLKSYFCLKWKFNIPGKLGTTFHLFIQAARWKVFE